MRRGLRVIINLRLLMAGISAEDTAQGALHAGLSDPAAPHGLPPVKKLFREIRDAFAAISSPVGVSSESSLELELRNGSRIVVGMNWQG